MLSHWIRARARVGLEWIARALGAAGFTPNALTLVGFIAMCGIGVLLAFGFFALGGILIVLAGIFDSLDGTLARLKNQTSAFGAFLDSTTDRFAEGALLLGIMYAFVQRGVVFVAYLAFLAMLGSLMVSYTRARAEGLGVKCDGGLLTRFERIAILVAGLVLTAFFGDLPILIALVLIALLAHLTAVQRIWLVYRATRS